MKRIRSRKGASYLAILVMVTGLSVVGVTYLDASTFQIRSARRGGNDAQMIQLCDAGIHASLREVWRPFKLEQRFDPIDTLCDGADEDDPKAMVSGLLPGKGRYAAGIIEYKEPESDEYQRLATVRSTGWVDYNENGLLDASEPVRVVDVKIKLELTRSRVFDYTYFVNNYGWMSGFGENDLVVNGDMRANGNFSFTHGAPTVNGAVIASPNEKLPSGVEGKITGVPVKWQNATYKSIQASASNPDNELRWRPAYDEALHGARGSALYNQWKDIIFDSAGSVSGDELAGSILMDANGSRGWDKTSTSATETFNILDTTSSGELIMPDLRNLGFYQNESTRYRDRKQFFSDGTRNPYYNQGAWVEVWNTTTSRYERLSVNGNISGSAILIGTETNPIKIHGPVTVSQDVVIKGVISGQGTLYAGRNVHIVGSIRYKSKPNFQGTSPSAIEKANEKRDLLGLAARGSVMMGNPNTFISFTLGYMRPPFTKPRLDDNGNTIPAYDALQVDGTGRPLYKSVIPDATMNAIAEGVNQIDAILYTNFVGGGQLGTSGGGVIYNGSVISKDEAMVIYSLPMRMNYDNRVRERSLTRVPLIDVQLPRTPVMIQSGWQAKGVSHGS